ncbi:MAG TPA: hypothetical protein DCE78_07920 [Bacteroidetes bacterium]|nr:hypothetical protein [Bacteroidota bacterium]
MLSQIKFLKKEAFISMNSLKFLPGLFLVFSLVHTDILAQDSRPEISDTTTVDSIDIPVVLSDSMFTEIGVIQLGELDGWYYTPTDSAHYRNVDINLSNWERLKPSELAMPDHINNNGYIKGWMRFKFQVDSTMVNRGLFLRSGTWGAMEVYVNGEFEQTFGVVSDEQNKFERYNPLNVIPPEFKTRFNLGETYTLAFRMEDRDTPWLFTNLGIEYRLDPLIRVASFTYVNYIQQVSAFANLFQYTITAAMIMILLLVVALFFLNRRDYVIRDSMIFIVLFTLTNSFNTINSALDITLIGNHISNLGFDISLHLIFAWIPLFLSSILIGSRSNWMKWLLVLAVMIAMITFLAETRLYSNIFIAFSFLLSMNVLYKGRSNSRGQNKIILIAVIGQLLIIIAYIFLEPFYLSNPASILDDLHIMVIFLFFPVMLVFYLAVRYTNNFKLLQEKLTEVQKLSDENLAKEREKQHLITMQKQVLEKEVEIRTTDLKQSLENLQSAQQQLVQQEKLASLGQLTAGIAHEIKNPLNFVNNFSSVSVELVDEALAEVAKLQQTETSEEIQDILNDVKTNLKKIHEHGTRADRIVKSMLLHSRGGSGKMEPSDLNALVKEYANLAYHGMRATKNPIDLDLKLELDPSIKKVPLIGEDFARVILNLCNNGFDALRDVDFSRQVAGNGTTPSNTDWSSVTPNEKHKPSVIVRTRNDGRHVYIDIEDNGSGIPMDIQSKILEPFFTTKKGTDGTGLGLSITNDIVKAHGGELILESAPGRTVFTIKLQS